MEDKIRRHVDELFSEAAPSRRSVELKEEMIQNLTEKYNDLLAGGKTPEAAYNIAIAGIGDVSVLLKDLEKDGVSPEVYAAARQKSAMLIAIAVALYILSVVPIAVLSALFPMGWMPGLVLMFLFIAGATGLLIYNGMTKPRFQKSETVVEEFKQWQSESREHKSMMNAIRSAIWTITVALYIVISFTTGAWYMTWVIFLVAAAVQAIVNAGFMMKK